MMATGPTPEDPILAGCESCGQPVASDGDRCPECDDGPTLTAPVGRT